MFKELRINNEIRAREVRLVFEDPDREPVVVSLNEALDIAMNEGLDLVEVAPQAKPVVCKVMDYGRYRYQQIKKEKDAKKQQKTINLKEVKLRPNIEDHDFETKVRHAERFLKAGDKVKVTIMFRGREITHPQLGKELCDRVVEYLADLAVVEKPAKVEGRNMTMVLTPDSKSSKNKEK